MDPAVVKGAALAVWFASLFLLERLFRASPERKGPGRLARNASLWGLTLVLSPLFVLPLALWADGHHLWTRPEILTGAAGLALSLLALDLWTYWIHRAYHEVPAMWRLHAPHHLDEHLDTTSAVRFHVGEIAFSALLRLIPILALSIPFTHLVIYETVLAASSFFHHSNVRLPARLESALSKIIVTPSIHWVHHHAKRADTDSNYASILSLWDPVFRTRSATKRTPEMKIGVEGVEEKTFLGLLLSPFQRM